MPIQAPSWTEFLSCPICYNEFAVTHRLPISLGCGHTLCRVCLVTLHNRQCPFDQTTITTHVENLPINSAILQLVSNGTGVGEAASGAGGGIAGQGTSSGRGAVGGSADAESLLTQIPSSVRRLNQEDLRCYKISKECIENLALHLRSFVSNFGSPLSRPMQRKLVTLINCQLMEEEGRVRALRAARSLGERTVLELILQHQNPQQLSTNLWASVRSRGCQFLGPSMQEEILKLILLALEDGSTLSRKALVMFVVHRLEPRTTMKRIGDVVQLLYRASCFNVSKREADAPLMQLKEEFRTYDALRREHDSQIVQIATEAGLRIAPDQWSSLLYGDTLHTSHMQSIIAKLQRPSSFAQSIQELVIALQRTGDPANLESLRTHLKDLAFIDPSLENAAPTWEELANALDAVRQVVIGLVEFMQQHGNRKLPDSAGAQGCLPNTKYKTSLCRDLTMRRVCPRGTSCTLAHSEEELERYRAKSRKSAKASAGAAGTTNPSIAMSGAPPPKKDGFQLHQGHHGAAVLMHPDGEMNTPVSTVAPSTMRFTTSAAHNKNGYASATSGSSNSAAASAAAAFFSKKHSRSNMDAKGQPTSARQNNAANSVDNFMFNNAYMGSSGSTSASSSSSSESDSSDVGLSYPYSHSANVSTRNESLLDDSAGATGGVQMNPHAFWNSCASSSSKMNGYAETAERDRTVETFGQSDSHMLVDEGIGSFQPKYNSVMAGNWADAFLKNWNTSNALNTDIVSSGASQLTHSASATSNEHSLVDDHRQTAVMSSNLSSYPVFSNATEEKLPLNLQCNSNSPPVVSTLPASVPPAQTPITLTENHTDSLMAAFTRMAERFNNIEPVERDPRSVGADVSRAEFGMNGLHIQDEVLDDTKIEKSCVVTDALMAAIWGSDGTNTLKHLAANPNSDIWKKPGVISAILKEHQQTYNAEDPDLEIVGIVKHIWSIAGNNGIKLE